MFRTNSNKGFFMEFENGFGISVQWGTMNYCSVKNHESGIMTEMIGNSCFGKCDTMIDIGDNNQVQGWLTTNDVAKVIEIVSKFKTENTIKKKIKELNL